jgi:hypothetical protein
MIKKPPDEETDESQNVTFVGMDIEPVSRKEYKSIMQEHSEAWREAWRRKMGANTVLRTSSRLDPYMKHLGFEPVSVSWGTETTLAAVMSSWTGSVMTDIALVHLSQEKLSAARKIPDEQLTPRQLTHLKLARKIASQFLYPSVAGVYAAIIPPATDRYGERTDGLYNKVTREIYIHLLQLERARTTVDTLIHELAHHTSGAEDGQEEFNAEMTRVAARVVESTAAREFDEELKGALW